MKNLGEEKYDYADLMDIFYGTPPLNEVVAYSSLLMQISAEEAGKKESQDRFIVNNIITVSLMIDDAMSTRKPNTSNNEDMRRMLVEEAKRVGKIVINAELVELLYDLYWDLSILQAIEQSPNEVIKDIVSNPGSYFYETESANPRLVNLVMAIIDIDSSDLTIQRRVEITLDTLKSYHTVFDKLGSNQELERKRAELTGFIEKFQLKRNSQV